MSHGPATASAIVPVKLIWGEDGAVFSVAVWMITLKRSIGKQPQDGPCPGTSERCTLHPDCTYIHFQTNPKYPPGSSVMLFAALLTVPRGLLAIPSDAIGKQAVLGLTSRVIMAGSGMFFHAGTWGTNWQNHLGEWTFHSEHVPPPLLLQDFPPSLPAYVEG